jgi:hypothetical protein
VTIQGERSTVLGLRVELWVVVLQLSLPWGVVGEAIEILRFEKECLA